MRIIRYQPMYKSERESKGPKVEEIFNWAGRQADGSIGLKSSITSKSSNVSQE